MKVKSNQRFKQKWTIKTKQTKRRILFKTLTRAIWNWDCLKEQPGKWSQLTILTIKHTWVKWSNKALRRDLIRIQWSRKKKICKQISDWTRKRSRLSLKSKRKMPLTKLWSKMNKMSRISWHPWSRCLSWWINRLCHNQRKQRGQMNQLFLRIMVQKRRHGKSHSQIE